MRNHFMSAALVLLAGFGANMAQAQVQHVRATELSAADATSNVPDRSGEASTMTNGVPNLLASNVQPGEMGIQSKLTIRRTAPAYGGDPGLKLMGGPGLYRPVMIAPPTTP